MEPWVFADENLDLLNSIIQKSSERSKYFLKNDLHILFQNNLNLEGNINDTTTFTNVITISSDDEDIESTDVQNSAQVEIIEISDDIKLLLDNFESNEDSPSLEDDDFLQTMNAKNVENTFKYLAIHLSAEGLHKFCFYLTSLRDINGVDNVVKNFCAMLLYPKFMNSIINRNIEVGVMEILKYFETVICENVFERLIGENNPNLKVIISICETLGETSNAKLLNKFLLACKKLQSEDQIELLQTLYVTNTDNELKKRVIHLLSDCAEVYATSKIYGQFMITVLKSLQTDFNDLENSLYAMVEQNQSIYKRSAEKILENIFSN